MSTSKLPLSGVRIADFTIHNAGPFGTHVLSQLGAEIIKFESKARPDALRKPHAVYGRMGPATFDQVTANKLSVRLNLKKTEAVDLAKRVVAISDIAAESFRAGVMKRLGLDFETLCQVKPDLVMLSLSSCGQDGPDSHFAGYAPLFGAWGGLGALTGYPDGPPVEIRHVMDHASGYHGALAVIAALLQRRRTGKPQLIDLAAREVSSAMIGDALVMGAMGLPVKRPGNGDIAMAPHGVYATAQDDRWLTIAVRNDQEFLTLLNILEKQDFATDSRFNTVIARRQNSAELDGLMTQWLASCNAEETAEALQVAGVCAHVSWSTQDIANDPHLHSRKTLVNVDDTSNPDRLAVGSPDIFSKSAEVGIRRGTPDLGQDEDYVFGELLGLDRKQRQDLEEREIIF